MIPRIAIEGGPRERGRQYGEGARELVRRSVDAYRDVFAHVAGWDWERVRSEAERFRAPIAAFDARYLEEIEGIAEGAGLDPTDVLAINVRTEVMFAATARAAADTRRLPHECSAFAVEAARSAEGRLLVGQNWDWLLHSIDTIVIVEASQPDRPDYVTVVEAGLLAKTGLNAAGVALVTNALVCDADRGEPGVPYHVLLRAILDSETLSDALAALTRAERASSANYLVAQDGVALDLEAAPGDYARVFMAEPRDGVLLHTNHFVNPGFDGRDVAPYAMPDSPFRLARFRQLIAAHPEPLAREALTAMLSDHANHPLGVCCHPDTRLEPADRWQTVAAVVMDPERRRLWVADGTPCAAPFELLDYGDRLGVPA